MSSQAIKKAIKRLRKREREIAAAYHRKKLKKGADNETRADDKGDGHR